MSSSLRVLNDLCLLFVPHEGISLKLRLHSYQERASSIYTCTRLLICAHYYWLLSLELLGAHYHYHINWQWSSAELNWQVFIGLNLFSPSRMSSSFPVAGNRNATSAQLLLYNLDSPPDYEKLLTILKVFPFQPLAHCLKQARLAQADPYVT